MRPSARVAWLVAVLAAAGSTSAARAQYLDVRVRPIGTLLQGDEDLGAWDGGNPLAVDCSAMLVFPDGSEVDVTMFALFTSSDAAVGTFTDHTTLQLTIPGWTEVRATYGGLVSPPVWLGETSYYSTCGGDPPLNEDDIKSAVEEGLSKLAGLGLPADGLLEMWARCRFLDNNAFASIWGNQSWLGPDDLAMFTPPWLGIHINQNLQVLVSRRPMVTLSHGVAQGMVNGGFFSANHTLSTQFADVIHELMHGLIWANGGGFTEEQEHNVILPLLNAMNAAIAAMDILGQSSMTSDDYTRLQGYLTTIKSQIQAIRKCCPELADMILDLLGWRDLDGDDLPDFINIRLGVFQLEYFDAQAHAAGAGWTSAGASGSSDSAHLTDRR